MSVKRHVAHVVLNRPRAGNRVNTAMVQELVEAGRIIDQEDVIRVVVLKGAGNTFSSGWERLRIRSKDEINSYQAAEVIGRIRKPVVAAINGDAIGQGLELALAADIRLAVATARFGMPQVQHGVLPWDGATQRLPRLIGEAYALELLLTGVIIDASNALRMGLIHNVVRRDELQKTLDHLVNAIAVSGPLAVQYVKEAVLKGQDMVLDQGLRLEADLNILLHSTRDRSAGIRSFLERRPVRYLGK